MPKHAQIEGALKCLVSVHAQGTFPPVLVNKFVNDVPLTVDDVRKVVMAKVAKAAKQAA